MKRVMVVGSLGAIAGMVVAFAGLAMNSGLLIDNGTGFVTVDQATGSGRGTITAGTDALFLSVLLFGVIGGGLIGYLTAAIARSWRPGEARFGPGPIGVFGAVSGAIASYSALRVGIGLGGSIVNEVVTMSAFRAVVILLVAGAASGAVVAVIAERYSRVESLGLEGDAWPSTVATFMKESVPAMLIPLLAIVVIATAVVGVAQVLLAGGAVGSIVVASVMAVAVLGGGAFLTRSPSKD